MPWPSSMCFGFDDDLAAEATRIRGPLTGIHPTLERALGPRITHTAVLEILSRCGGPIGLADTSRRTLISIATTHALRMGQRLVDELQAALAEQTVAVTGAAAADMVLPCLAESLKQCWSSEKRSPPRLRDPRCAPLAGVLTSVPGIGVRTAARILLEIGDASAFASSAHLAAYTGMARSPTDPAAASGANTPARTGNRKLKRAFFLAAFAALSVPVSRAYYDKKRAEGKKEAQRRAHLPRPRTLRRPVRPAPQNPLPAKPAHDPACGAPSRRLTKHRDTLRAPRPCCTRWRRSWPTWPTRM